MQKTATKAKSSSSYSRPALQKSTTLSRKYVRKPGAAKISDVKKVTNKATDAAASKAAKSIKVTDSAVKAVAAKAASVAKAEIPKVAFKTKARAAELSKAISASAKSAPIKAKKVERSAVISRFGAKKAAAAKVKKMEPKKAEVQKSEAKKLVVKKVAVKRPVEKASTDAARAAMRGLATMESTKPMKKSRGKRFALALGCAAIVVAILGVFVAVNMPNISVKVAAMQTGIDAEYPGFVPRNYSMETVASDKSGKVTMKFVGPDGVSFVLTEEKSTWDSTAVLNNYVKTTYSANYSTMHEQGVTYYTESGSAVWVNGGILYKITSYGKNLSREQIRNLVVSL